MFPGNLLNTNINSLNLEVSGLHSETVYLFIIYITFCEIFYYYCFQSSTNHYWYVCIPKITYIKTVTIVLRHFLVPKCYAQLPINFSSCCSLYKHTFILPVSPIAPEQCCVTMGCIRVESRLARGLNVWIRALVEVNDWQPISLVQGDSSRSTIWGKD